MLNFVRSHDFRSIPNETSNHQFFLLFFTLCRWFTKLNINIFSMNSVKNRIDTNQYKHIDWRSVCVQSKNVSKFIHYKSFKLSTRSTRLSTLNTQLNTLLRFSLIYINYIKLSAYQFYGWAYKINSFFVYLLLIYFNKYIFSCFFL